MVRPRWHDAVIVSAIVGLLAVGVWSLWGDDVRSALHVHPSGPSEPATDSAPGHNAAGAPIAAGTGQT